MKVRVGYESSVMRAGWPTRSADDVGLIDLARARASPTESMTSMMPRPERTSSPSCTSPIVPLFHVDFSTTMPSIGETTRILSALLSACFHAFIARSR